MRKRRHGKNPARVRMQAEALARSVTGEAAATGAARGIRALGPLACLLSAAVLLVSFAPFDQWYLAYVALVPLGLAVTTWRSGPRAMLWAWLAGAAFWGVGLYWLTWITLVGYAALMAYLGTYWVAAGWLLRRAQRRGWPMWASLPVVWVALEYARGFALSGFPWFYLAHSQHANTPLIQIADATGQYGVSFFVAMVNGAVMDAVGAIQAARAGRQRLPVRRLTLPVGACALVLAAMLGYGSYRLSQDASCPLARVGIVQMAFPNSLFHRGADLQEIFDQHVDNTRPLVGRGCHLVVWAESMVGYPNMDPDHWARFDPAASQPSAPHEPLFSPEDQEIIRLYQGNLRTLAGLVRDLGCPLLAGGGMPVDQADPEENLSYNGALLYDLDRTGRLRIANRYYKIHLVPFGEYVPFRRAWPGLHRWLRSFVPEKMPQLEPGRRASLFEVPGGDGPVRFVVPICYEGVFDRLCRSLVAPAGRKRADLLVNISNDGWFIWVRSEGRSHASTELPQHLAQYVFRAIENRVPVIRAVNTGISGHIDSCGRVVATVRHNGAQRMVAGTLVTEVLADRRVSRYSRVGDVFAAAVCVVAAVGAAALHWPGRSRKRKAGPV